MTSQEARASLARLGVDAFRPEEALSLLRRLVELGTPQAVAARVDWNRFIPVFEAKARGPLLGPVKARRRGEPKDPTNRRSALLQRLEEAPRGHRASLLAAHVQEVVAQVLGLSPGEVLEPGQGFAESGMDSLMAIELKTRLEESLGRSLPSTLAFDSPTVEDLAAYLAREVLALQPPGQARDEPRRESPRIDALLAGVEHLSETDAIRTLLQPEEGA
jgi:acyl carrier protein